MNGQEKDDEIKGAGLDYDFKYRHYDPRLGRFISVDPLTKKYPHWTPYQFAGNMPIQFREMEGLEPSKNPKEETTGSRAAKADVLTISDVAQSKNEVLNTTNAYTPLQGTQTNERVQGTLGKATESGIDYSSDTYQSNADTYNTFVGQTGTFEVNESNVGIFKDYESYITSTLLQNFVTGQGPENYVFPANGIISQKFLASSILSDALNAYKANGGKTTLYNFGINDLVGNALFDPSGSLINIVGFTGSGSITIVPHAKGLEVTIFNVTSLASGALIGKADMPTSNVRVPGQTTPFGNISQTFKLNLPFIK